MKTYNVRLEAKMSDSFRATRAANSLDIDVAKKSIHELTVNADIDAPFSVGLILGASGSGKTTLAKQMFGAQCFRNYLDNEKAVIDQFPEAMNYEDCAAALSGIGLSSVPCWLKPVGTLSNGQRARAEASIALSQLNDSIVCIDEWTSVVDRTVAKVMSHCVQKFARRSHKKIVLVSCHYDVIEWLNPDWIIDCNNTTFTDRRSLRRERQEKLQFTVREVTSRSWHRFSKYHYLTDKAVGGRCHHFGLFHGSNQIGYNCLVNYVPWTDKKKPMIMHVSRTVIHPDYAGMGLGIMIDTAVSEYGVSQLKYRVLAKFSSIPFYKMMSRHPAWKHLKTTRQIGATQGGSIDRARYRKEGKKAGFRENVKTYSFEYIGIKTR